MGRYTRPIRKITSGEQLTKQAMRKKCYIQKNSYILSLFLNVVTTGTEALVWGNKSCCMPASKKSAELSHVFTPSMSSSLVEEL
jgi:hypothetical protein